MPLIQLQHTQPQLFMNNTHPLSDRDCQVILSVICKAQSIIHDMDELQGSSFFKHEIKKKSNQLIRDFEAILSPYYKILGVDSLEALDKALKELDNFANTVTFTEKEPLF